MLEEQHVRRLAVAVQHVGVRLADRVGDDLVAHEAPVDEEVLRVAAGAGVSGPGGEAGEREARRLDAHLDRVGGEVVAEHPGGALARPLGRQVREAPAVVGEREGHGRARQGDARERLVAARELGGLALQELAPGRRVEVELLDLDRGARGERGRLEGRDRPRLAGDAPGVALPGPAAGDGEPGNGPDRGQRLAAEAQGGRPLQVLDCRDLAGCKAGDGQCKLFGLDAAAVVGHAQPPHAAVHEVHRDGLGIGVEAVLEQFLQRGGGPLDDLARRDLIDE